MKKWPDLMVDIEALGPSPMGVITQIAAVPFDITTGEHDRENQFEVSIDIQSNLDMGRIVDGSTIDWWMKQDKGAIDQVYNVFAKMRLPAALVELNRFAVAYCMNDPNRGVWSHATYDFVMIQDAYRGCQLITPFSYKSSNDIRTLNTLYTKFTGKKSCDVGSFAGTKHNAVDDCIHQIKYCSAMMKALHNDSTKIQ